MLFGHALNALSQGQCDCWQQAFRDEGYDHTQGENEALSHRIVDKEDCRNEEYQTKTDGNQ